MAAFDDCPETFERLDWSLLQNGFVNLYWRLSVLAEDTEWLRRHQYTIIEFDAAEWSTENRMHVAFAAAFAFPTGFGCNLDALNDCLFDLPIPDDGGMAIVIRNFDRFDDRYHPVSTALLDILSDRCRVAALFGQRLIVMLHTNDPTFHTGDFGKQTANWNPREFMASTRGV